MFVSVFFFFIWNWSSHKNRLIYQKTGLASTENNIMFQTQLPPSLFLLGYERVHLPVGKVVDTPFNIQGNDYTGPTAQ